jgi:hypothetical protein
VPLAQVFIHHRLPQGWRQYLCRLPRAAHGAGQQHIGLDRPAACQAISQTLDLPDALCRKPRVFKVFPLLDVDILAVPYQVQMRQAATSFLVKAL